MSSGRARREPMDARRAQWETTSPSAHPGDRQGRHDRYSIVLPGGDGADSPVFIRATEVLRRYDIYSPRRMRSLVCSDDGRVRTGALIIQRIIFGPMAVEAAVRVVELFGPRQRDRAFGFTCVTLVGHAEKGVASFFVARDAAGVVSFHIDSWSMPSGGTADLIAPLARPLQKALSREALRHVRSTVAL